jgi:hypothetical protein
VGVDAATVCAIGAIGASPMQAALATATKRRAGPRREGATGFKRGSGSFGRRDADPNG